MALSRLPSHLVHAASMPTLATTVMELREAEMLFEVAGALDDSDASSSDEENADMLRLAACEPLMRRRLQNIGPERLSLARLQREYAARGFDDLDVCTEVTHPSKQGGSFNVGTLLVKDY